MSRGEFWGRGMFWSIILFEWLIAVHGVLWFILFYFILFYFILFYFILFYFIFFFHIPDITSGKGWRDDITS